jgi:Abnormal spindle-like microcephaly-assoc'd, ASPM-SPD-2-Hydin
MRIPGRKTVEKDAGLRKHFRTWGFQLGSKSKFLSVMAMALSIALLQACGGSSNSSNFTASTTGNPAPGDMLQAIQITPATSLISLGEKRQLFATGVYSNGSSIPLTSGVIWSVSSGTSSSNFVTVSSQGVATGAGIGESVVSATVGSVTSVISLVVDTNGYTSSSVGVMSVPYKNTVVDAAYLAQSLSLNQGSYAVQEVNLDADQFSNVTPPPVALLASVPMPAGFVPNATVADQSDFLVAVISYGSPVIQIIDASNLSSDVASNQVVSSITIPVTQKVTINGVSCMICAGVFDPLEGEILLSTAQGYYSANLTTGAVQALPFTPTPAPASNFTLNASATPPYLLSSNPDTGELQMINLTTNAVTTLTSGLTSPATSVIDLVNQTGVVVDAATNSESLIDLTNPQTAVFTPLPGIGGCGTPVEMNMAALSVAANPNVNSDAPVLFTSQTSGNCVGFQANSLNLPLSTANLVYSYTTMFDTPDGKTFVNGGDPNRIATFNDVYSSSHTNYGLLVDANQQWMARIGLSWAGNTGELPNLPAGAPIPTNTLCLPASDCSSSVVYLPTPSAEVTLSEPTLDFGSVAVGTQTSFDVVTVANIGPNLLPDTITLSGTNAANFVLQYSCDIILQPQSNCSIQVGFLPTAVGAVSAVVSVTAGNAPAQTIALSGTGTGS